MATRLRNSLLRSLFYFVYLYMRLGIVGARDFFDYDFVKSHVESFIGDDTIIVSGGAKGVDTIAEEIAKEYGIYDQMIIHPAKWKKYGKSAGKRRNSYIVRDSDYIVAFKPSRPSGTADTIAKAEATGVPVKVVHI